VCSFINNQKENEKNENNGIFLRVFRETIKKIRFFSLFSKKMHKSSFLNEPNTNYSLKKIIYYCV